MKKTLPALLILLAGLAFWLPSQWKLLKMRQALLDSQAQLSALRDHLAAGASDLDSARREQEAQIKARVRASAAIGRTQQALAKQDPDSLWANPPASLPDWNPRSPYIWLPKDFLPRLHPSMFDGKGRMTDEAASILAVDEPTRHRINDQLAQALADYQSLQLARAQATNQPMEGKSADGSVVTVQIPAMPEAGTEFQDQVKQILQRNLGDQRADLVARTAQDWLQNESGRQPMIYSVTRLPGGLYAIDSDTPTGGKSSSSGIPASDAVARVPAYLLPLFADVFPPPDQGQ